MPNAHLKGIHLALPGYDGKHPTLEIFQYEKNLDNGLAVSNRKGFGHIAFVVDDVKAVVDALLEHGGSLVGEIVETEIPGAGFITFVYTRDVDGNIIEIQHWK